MKTTSIFSALILIMSSFTLEINTADQIGRKVLEAFQRGSNADYTLLYPSLQEFHLLMDQHASVYGNTLDDAKNEFALTYAKKIIPAMHDSFDRLLEEGKELGIDWQYTEFVRVEYNDFAPASFGAATLTIVFAANGEEHKIIVEKALIVNGRWRVSQFARLV